MKHGMGITIVVGLLTGLLAGCGHTRGPDERTDDGLVRVPSRAAGGVYRAPGVDFTPYKRIILEPPTIEFVKGWRKKNEAVTDKEIARIQADVVKLFRDEFTNIVVEEGPYEFADAPGDDVLLVVPRIVDFDIPAPEAGNTAGLKQYTPGPVKMQVVGEMRDTGTNALVARVIVFEGQERYGMNDLRLASRASNSHEMRLGFAKWSRMALEALNVAKAGQVLPE